MCAERHLSILLQVQVNTRLPSTAAACMCKCAHEGMCCMITACALFPTHTVLSPAILIAYMPSGQHLAETLSIHAQVSHSRFTRPLITALDLTAALGWKGAWHR